MALFFTGSSLQSCYNADESVAKYLLFLFFNLTLFAFTVLIKNSRMSMSDDEWEAVSYIL